MKDPYTHDHMPAWLYFELEPATGQQLVETSSTSRRREYWTRASSLVPLPIVTHNGAGPVAVSVPQVFVTIHDLSFADRVIVPLDRGPEMTIKMLLIVGEKKTRRSIASIDNTIDSQKGFLFHLSLKDGSWQDFRPLSFIPSCRHLFSVDSRHLAGFAFNRLASNLFSSQRESQGRVNGESQAKAGTTGLDSVQLIFPLTWLRLASGPDFVH